MTIQERLDELNPYVSTIRYDKTPVVEVEFPVDWGVPKSESISFKAIKEDVETKTVRCVVYSEKPKTSIDDLLDFIKRSIKLNKEREMKNELFKTKVSELKSLFNKTELSKLNGLKFTIPEDYMDLNSGYDLDAEVEAEKSTEETTKTEPVEDSPETKKPKNEVVVEEPSKNGKPVLADFDTPQCNCEDGSSCPSCTDL
jgi:hypothetical protein